MCLHVLMCEVCKCVQTHALRCSYTSLINSLMNPTYTINCEAPAGDPVYAGIEVWKEEGCVRYV